MPNKQACAATAQARHYIRELKSTWGTWRAVCRILGIPEAFAQSMRRAASGEKLRPGTLAAIGMPCHHVTRLHELPTADITRRLRDRFDYAPGDEQCAAVAALTKQRVQKKRNLRQYHGRSGSADTN